MYDTSCIITDEHDAWKVSYHAHIDGDVTNTSAPNHSSESSSWQLAMTSHDTSDKRPTNARPTYVDTTCSEAAFQKSISDASLMTTSACDTNVLSTYHDIIKTISNQTDFNAQVVTVSSLHGVDGLHCRMSVQRYFFKIKNLTFLSMITPVISYTCETRYSVREAVLNRQGEPLMEARTVW